MRYSASTRSGKGETHHTAAARTRLCEGVLHDGLDHLELLYLALLSELRAPVDEPLRVAREGKEQLDTPIERGERLHHAEHGGAGHISERVARAMRRAYRTSGNGCFV